MKNTMNHQMNHKMKMMTVDAIMKVVNSAPTRKGIVYSNVTKESFDIWMNYVYTVLDIISEYIDADMYFEIHNDIQDIISQNGGDYSRIINMVCQKLLDFAKEILRL